MTTYNLLTNLEDDLIRDWFNFQDSSVGIYSVGKIDKTVVEELEESNCTVLSYTENSVVFECEGKQFEIYEETYKISDNEMESKWAIREYATKQE